MVILTRVTAAPKRVGGCSPHNTTGWIRSTQSSSQNREAMAGPFPQTKEERVHPTAPQRKSVAERPTDPPQTVVFRVEWTRTIQYHDPSTTACSLEQFLLSPSAPAHQLQRDGGCRPLRVLCDTNRLFHTNHHEGCHNVVLASRSSPSLWVLLGEWDTLPTHKRICCGDLASFCDISIDTHEMLLYHHSLIGSHDTEFREMEIRLARGGG